MQLAQRLPDGQPLRAHLEAAAAAGAAPDPRLHAQPPAAGRALWQAFVDLSGARPVGMAPSALPPTEIDAWARLNGLRFTGWEVGTLMAMDRAALAVHGAKGSPA